MEDTKIEMVIDSTVLSVNEPEMSKRLVVFARRL